MKVKLLLIFILFLGAFLRMYHIDQKSRFIWDEARDMRAIRNIWVEKDITLFGPYNQQDGKKDFYGVFHYYLMLPSLVVADFDPMGPNVFTALTGVATIFIMYRLLKIIGESEFVSLSTTLIYAVSPLVARYQQWAWNPNTTGFFGLIYLYIVINFLKSKNSNYVIIPNLKLLVAGIFLGLVFQLHYVSAVIGIIGFILLWQNSNQISKNTYLKWKSFLTNSILVIVGFIIPNLTFVIFDLTHKGFYRQIIFDSFFNSSSSGLLFQSKDFLWQPFRISLEVFGGLFGITQFEFIFLILGILILLKIFMINQKIKALKNDFIKMGLLKGLLTCVIVILFSSLVLGKLIKPYQLAPLFPIIIWAIVYYYDQFYKNHSFKLKGINIIFLASFLVYQNQIFRSPTWMENLPQIRSISNLIINDAKSVTEPFNLTSLVEADNTALRYRYFVERAGLKPLGLEEYPQAKILYVISFEQPLELSDNNEWQIETFKEASPSSLLGNVNQYYVYKVTKP